MQLLHMPLPKLKLLRPAMFKKMKVIVCLYLMVHTGSATCETTTEKK
jgi:hypothetical protein